MPFISASAISPYNSIRGGGAEGGAALLLDLYPDAAAAYSLTYLKSSFIGNPVIRVRRSSDNEEQDFTPIQITDGTLTAFTGVGDGFVTTVNGQSIMPNLIQPSDSFQPKIVSNGVLYLGKNNLPAIKFDGVDDFMYVDEPSISVNSDYSMFFVIEPIADLVNTEVIVSYGRTLNSRYIGISPFYSGSLIFNNTGYGSSVQDSFNISMEDKPYLISSISTNNASSITHYVDGQTGAGPNTAISAAVGPDRFQVGNGNRGTEGQYSGLFQSCVLFKSDQSANRAGIEANINNHYTIY